MPSFTDCSGQAVSVLLASSTAASLAFRSFLAGSSGQGFLLTGPSGIGKQALALHFACALLCAASDGRPCGRCGDCRRVQGGTHPNLLTAQSAAGDRSVRVEQLRSLRERLGTYSQEAGKRVVLLADAETLTPQAQSALLKVLEEPDSDTVFLLTSSNPNALLPTVRSRLKNLALGEWAQEDVLRFLKDCGIEPERALELSRACAGRPGLALSLHGDDRYWKARAAAEASFFSVTVPERIPAASALLKEWQEEAELLISLVELEARTAMRLAAGAQASSGQPSRWAHASLPSLARVMQAACDARRYRASNVAWQAVADRLLITVAKEIYSCRLQ